MGRLFGTDGVRGVVNKELTADLAMKVGNAAARVLTEADGKRPVIALGMDTRISGDFLAAALAFALVYRIGWLKVWLICVAMLALWGVAAFLVHRK